MRGFTLGRGFELALDCDIIVASADAKFALPEARLGLIAGAGGVFRFTRRVPYLISLGHLLTGRPISATRAYELGLDNEVVAEAELDDCAGRWVADQFRTGFVGERHVRAD